MDLFTSYLVIFSLENSTAVKGNVPLYWRDGLNCASKYLTSRKLIALMSQPLSPWLHLLIMNLLLDSTTTTPYFSHE